MIILFWILFAAVIYCYIGYPLLIFLLARIRPKAIRQADIEPAVSVLISLYNEEDVIAAKLHNLLEQDYPPEKIEILIGSDGSTDRTHQIINGVADPRIKLFIHPDRRGKMATLNGLVPNAKNEIAVFTDARQTFEKDAIRKLVRNFADPQVGCVSGELEFIPEEGMTARGVGLYWQYEKFIRFQESRVHSILGATGAIYAIRRKLFVPGPANIVLDDMHTPFKIIEQGYRAVFDDTAHAYDKAAGRPKEEFRRKARTLYGNYQIFCVLPGMFNLFRSPVSLQLFSHKFLRVILPFFLMALIGLNYSLRQQPVFDVLWGLQAVFYGMAFIGMLTQEYKEGSLKIISKICYVPHVFCLLNLSALAGFWRFITDQQQVTWKKARDI
jgi:biofilm PGA synthesis N-glycosyltransferase PgaC